MFFTTRRSVYSSRISEWNELICKSLLEFAIRCVTLSKVENNDQDIKQNNQLPVVINSRITAKPGSFVETRRLLELSRVQGITGN